MNKCTQWFGGLSGLNFPCWQELALNESVLSIDSFFLYQKKKKKIENQSEFQTTLISMYIF